MSLTMQPISRRLPAYQQAKQLYRRAFPRYERAPWLWLMLKGRQQRADFWAFFDDDRFVGLAFVIHGRQRIHYLYYLAVNDQVRSKGYGSRILTQLRQKMNGETIVLDCEQPDPAADNHPQRVRRIAFYAKNGFYQTKHFHHDRGVSFHVLATQRSINRDHVDELVRWWSWPLGWLIP